MADASNCVMVAGIDFGTTYSGYGFSFHGKETDIKLNKNWGNSQGFLSYKVPTCVLLDANEQFEAFGFQAEQKYLEALEDYEDGQPVSTRKQLFRNFKMMLHREKKVTINSKVSSVGKKSVPALDIFMHSLKFMKSHLIEELSKQLATPPSNDMIRWVITVPAIWTEQSKQFMREAAFRAGLMADKYSKQLIIALEPETASFYCRQLDLAHFANREGIAFSTGTNYWVLDCGGGTNDMVAHTIVDKHKVKELFAVNGGNLGGNKINESFINLLEDLLGTEFIQIFQNECPEQWFNFMIRFERSKKMAQDDGDTRLKVEIPSEMKEVYEIHSQGKRLKEILNLKERGIRFVSGSLVLSNEVVCSLFNDTINQIVLKMKAYLESKQNIKFQYIFMVGGFSESSFLQKAVKHEFETEECKVLIPHEADLAIIKGAVLYGHYHDKIVSRISRQTYGTKVRSSFIAGLHDESRLWISPDGNRKCRGLFSSFVEMNEEVSVGSTKENYFVVYPTQTQVPIPIYRMKRKSNCVEYADNPDLHKMGSIVLDCPTNPLESCRDIVVKVTFGGTELYVEAVDKTSGNIMGTSIDFLAD